MRVVIIGGRGMIGRALAHLAASGGHEVILLSRKAPSPHPGVTKTVTLQWDGKDVESLADILDGMDAVVNLAGESIGKGRWTSNRKDAILQSRLEPASALVDAILLCKRPPKTLVQASAVGVYGTGTETMLESSNPGSDFLARLAVQWEGSTKKVESHGVRRVVIRTGLVLQKGEGVLPQLMMPFQFLVGGPTGTGKQFYSWIHIEDEVGAILFLLENPACNGVYNLTAPNPCSNEEFGKTLARILKKPYWLPLPGVALKLVLGEMSTLVLEGQRVLPYRLQEAGYDFKFPTLEAALKDLL